MFVTNEILVGAPLEDGSGAGVNPPVKTNTAFGAAYLLLATNSSVLSGYVKSSHPGPDNDFGSSIAGDTMVIETYRDTSYV